MGRENNLLMRYKNLPHLKTKEGSSNSMRGEEVYCFMAPAAAAPAAEEQNVNGTKV